MFDDKQQSDNQPTASPPDLNAGKDFPFKKVEEKKLAGNKAPIEDILVNTEIDKEPIKELKQEKVQENLDKIMEYALKTQRVVNDDVERIIGVKDTQAAEYLNTLVKQGKLVKFGKTINIFYKPTSK